MKIKDVKDLNEFDIAMFAKVNHISRQLISIFDYEGITMLNEIMAEQNGIDVGLAFSLMASIMHNFYMGSLHILQKLMNHDKENDGNTDMSIEQIHGYFQQGITHRMQQVNAKKEQMN